MKTKDILYKLLVAIAVITLISGVLQMLQPGLVLGVVGGEGTPGNLHSFAIIGMFMLFFGGLLLHALLSEQHHPIAVFWAGLQKFGAFAAVGLGVFNGLLSVLALGVAIFDLFSGFLIIWYWLTIK